MFLMPSERRKASPPAILTCLLTRNDDGVARKRVQRYMLLRYPWGVKDIPCNLQAYLQNILSRPAARSSERAQAQAYSDQKVTNLLSLNLAPHLQLVAPN